MGAQLQHLPRREARVHKNLNLVLMVKSEQGEKKEAATTLDVGEHGLRVVTRLKLSRGQTVYAFTRHGRPRFGSCRVVWARQQPARRLNEAGLEIIR